MDVRRTIQSRTIDFLLKIELTVVFGFDDVPLRIRIRLTLIHHLLQSYSIELWTLAGTGARDRARVINDLGQRIDFHRFIKVAIYPAIYPVLR